MGTTQRTLSSPKVQAQLALCATAVTGLAVAPHAHAAVVTTFANTVITIPATAFGVYLNLETGLTGTSGSAVPGYDFNPYLTTKITPSSLGFYWGTPGGATTGAGVATGAATNLYADLPNGSIVSSASPTTAAIAGTTDSFLSSGTHILGFKFFGAAGTAEYGYMKIQTTATNGYPATILGWTFDNSGAAITVSAVPEPSTVAFLALAGGAVGVRAWRRRKAA